MNYLSAKAIYKLLTFLKDKDQPFVIRFVVHKDQKETEAVPVSKTVKSNKPTVKGPFYDIQLSHSNYWSLTVHDKADGSVTINPKNFQVIGQCTKEVADIFTETPGEGDNISYTPPTKVYNIPSVHCTPSTLNPNISFS